MAIHKIVGLERGGTVRLIGIFFKVKSLISHCEVDYVLGKELLTWDAYQ